MKKFYFLFVAIALIFLPKLNLSAKDGDTLKIRAIEFNGPRYLWVDFNLGSKKYQKVLINYKLKCPCGEWDYDKYVYAQEVYAPSFRVDSTVRDTFRYKNTQTYSYSAKLVGTNVVFDSTPNKSILVDFYGDTSKPTTRTSSKVVYPLSYTYKLKSFDPVKGTLVVDSTLIAPDSTIVLSKKRVYYSDAVTFIGKSWEIMRYITPYGNGLTLGTGDGFTWTLDVTDMILLLNGKVFISAENGQENLEMTFDFIEGTPAREVKRIETAWQGNPVYGPDIEKFLVEKTATLMPGEENLRLKMTQTGHGFGGSSDNCAEFCKKDAYVKVNGDKKYTQSVWRICHDNPVFPQGGTWLLDRTNWCPGREVKPFNFELSEFLNGGKSINVDYDMESFTQVQTPNGSNWVPNYRFAGFFIYYGKPNFKNNPTIVDVIAPTNKQEWSRFNPISMHPTFVLKNNGTDILKTVTIKYGVKDGTKYTYNWKGNLKFQQDTIVELPEFDTQYSSTSNSSQFEIEIVPNATELDENTSDNYALTTFTKIPVYGKDISFNLTTNNYDLLGSDSPYQWFLENDKGVIIDSLPVTENSKTYNKTVHLEKGNYKFTLINQVGYGLYFWAINSPKDIGFTHAKFDLLDGNLHKWKYNEDFGTSITHYFSVDDKPAISVSKDTLNYGKILLGDSSIQQVVVKPVNSKGLTITGVPTITLGDLRGFTLVSSTPTIPAKGITINEKDSLVLNIMFKPKKTGLVTVNLSLPNNDINNANKIIKLIGEGSDGTGVETNQTEENIYSINLMKNPISDNLEFSISNQINDELKLDNIMIIDNLGRISQNVTNPGSIGQNEYSLNLSNFNSGTYNLMVKIGNQSISKPFVVVK